MLNIDKYRNEILEIMKMIHSDDVAFSNNCSEYVAGKAINQLSKRYNLGITTYTSIQQLDWLFSEWSPPLLNNGDDLKLGDHIMVRYDEDEYWREKVFVFYSNGKFYATDAINLTNGLFDEEMWVIGYPQARLLEDGEMKK